MQWEIKMENGAVRGNGERSDGDGGGTSTVEGGRRRGSRRGGIWRPGEGFVIAGGKRRSGLRRPGRGSPREIWKGEAVGVDTMRGRADEILGRREQGSGSGEGLIGEDAIRLLRHRRREGDGVGWSRFLASDGERGGSPMSRQADTDDEEEVRFLSCE